MDVVLSGFAYVLVEKCVVEKFRYKLVEVSHILPSVTTGCAGICLGLCRDVYEWSTWKEWV